MLLAQDEGNVNDREAYCAWNTGQGLLVITEEPKAVVSLAKRLRFEAKVAGVINEESRITIRSRGLKEPGTLLSFKCER